MKKDALSALSTQTVIDRAAAIADLLQEEDAPSEKLGKLTDRAAQAVRDTGIARMLQPKRFQGLEANPVDFLTAVLSMGVQSGSAGWVAGVVGVHSHELAVASMEVQEEIWGEDPDTWVASPYAPMGVASPVEGGYIFNGRWPFSSGTDHCSWVMIGGHIANPDGSPNREQPRHFILPRPDYEIVEDSWDVMGLRGTGSKDLIVKDTFVPTHRVIDVSEQSWRGAVEELGLPWGVYGIPRAIMFAGTVNGATLGLAQRVLVEYVGWMRSSAAKGGQLAPRDPNKMLALGEAAADIDMAVQGYLRDFERAHDLAETKLAFSPEMRLEFRRNQIRSVQRAGQAADKLFAMSGGAALQHSHPLQRAWRDLRAGLQHGANAPERLLAAEGLRQLGDPLPPKLRGI